MAEKDFPLSITVRTVDRATAGLKQINDRLERLAAPFKALREQAGALRENMGLPKIAAGLSGIAGMVRGLATGVGVLGGAAAAAAFGFKTLVDSADELGDRAEQVGLTVDALAGLRFAAEEAGAASTDLDQSMEGFSRSLGQVRAGTGRLTGFLKKVSPELLRQLKATKSNEEAFNLLADAEAKLTDHSKRAALAAAAFGTSGIKLVPLLARGSKGVKELRDEFIRIAGSQQDAVDQAGALDGEFRRLSAAAAGVKAQILVGLGPAFLDLTKRARGFFEANREQIGEWIRQFGEKLPARLAQVGRVLSGVFDVLGPVVDTLRSMVAFVGGAENAVKLLVGAFLVFKGLQLVGHLASIAQGLIGVAAAARGAAVAMGAANAAAGAGSTAGAAGAAGGAAAGAARGGFMQFVKSLPFLAAVAVGAEQASSAILGDQANRQSAAERGAILRDDLKRFRERGDVSSRRMLEQSLRDGGFLDAKGRFQDTLENRQALSGGRALEDVGRVRIGGIPMALELKRTIEELNAFLAGRPTARSGGAPAAQPQKTKITVEFKDAPRGTRTTVDAGSRADVDVFTGYQLSTP